METTHEELTMPTTPHEPLEPAALPLGLDEPLEDEPLPGCWR